jgi:hypothetical protein
VSDVRYVHQHFDRPARFGWFTPFEWALVAAAAVITTVWWRYLSPFGFSTTATVAVLLNAPLYVYARMKDGRGARGFVVRVRIAWGWRTRPRRARGGGTRKAAGYLVTVSPIDRAAPAPAATRPIPDFNELWG